MAEKAKKAPKVFSINCTGCGAPVNLFGGHRVQQVVCGSCGANLDAKDEYRVIEKFKNLKRPKLPLKLGMTGKFQNVEFTIIGIVEWTEYDEGCTYKSYDFQLFSPTHGYVWLRRENFHYTFIHEVKDLPDRKILMSSPAGTKFTARDKKFTVVENGSEKITYVEGELTWVARQGDVAKYVSCACPPYLYEISEMHKERDFASGEYIEPEDVYRAFGLKGKPVKPGSIYYCQVYKPNIFTSTSFHALWFALASILIALLILVIGRGKTVFRQKFSANSFKDGVTSKAFTIRNPNALISLNLYCPFDNAWGYFDVSVQKNETEYFTLSKEISYYHGYEGGESWSEGSQQATGYFRVPEAGEYRLYVWGEGGTGDRGTTLQNKTLTVVIKEGVIVSRYFIIGAFVFALLAIFGVWRRIKYESERRGIDLSDYVDND